MIKYPRVEVSVKRHKQLTKMAKEKNTSMKVIVEKALSKYLNHL